jgi:hypothetical protein
LISLEIGLRRAPSHPSAGTVISGQWKIVGSFAQAQLNWSQGKQLLSFQRWMALHRDETQRWSAESPTSYKFAWASRCGIQILNLRYFEAITKNYVPLRQDKWSSLVGEILILFEK